MLTFTRTVSVRLVSVACIVVVVCSATASAALPRGGKVVASIGIPTGMGGFAVGEGAVWAMSTDVATLTRIDPVQNAVVASIKLPQTNICPFYPRSCGEAAAGEVPCGSPIPRTAPSHASTHRRTA